MSGNLTIRQARLVLPDRVVTGDVLVEDGVITEIAPRVDRGVGEEIQASGLVCLPGLIDPNVRAREPGLTRHEDLATCTRAAAAGGVTAILDLPDTVPPTTTRARLHEKLAMAAERASVHYGAWLGATADNLAELREAPRAIGVHLRLAPRNESDELAISDPDVLGRVMSEVPLPLAVHAADPARLRERTALYADAADAAMLPIVYDAETGAGGLRQVLELSARYGRPVHVQCLSSSQELAQLDEAARSRVTASVCLANLLLHAEEAAATLGPRAVAYPPLRPSHHADALWAALREGRVDFITSAHAPWLPEAKDRPWPATAPGFPGIEWTLPLLADRVGRGALSWTQVARWTSEAPARCLRLPRKGRIEVGYDADLVLVDPQLARVVDPTQARTRAGWSPWTGRELLGWPVMTVLLGRPVFRDGEIVSGVRGRELSRAG
jgi:dihydroorotase